MWGCQADYLVQLLENAPSSRDGHVEQEHRAGMNGSVCVCVCESATRTTGARIKEQHMFTAAEQHMGFHSYDQRATREGTNLAKDKAERRLKTTGGNKTTR